MLTADEYQAQALLTEYTPAFVVIEGMSDDHNMMVARLIHAVLGMASETGELADALKKHIIYNRELDTINVMEESADCSWYIALALTAVKKGLQEALETNIAKLRVRFPLKFDVNAVNNRNLAAERAALEGKK